MCTVFLLEFVKRLLLLFDGLLDHSNLLEQTLTLGQEVLVLSVGECNLSVDLVELVAHGVQRGRKLVNLITLLKGYIHEAVIGIGSLLILFLAHLVTTCENHSRYDCEHCTNLLHLDLRFD